MVVAFGLRERALAEHEAAEKRRQQREQLIHDSELALRMHYTEELVRQIFNLEVEASSGHVAIDRLTMGAYFLRVNGHTSWRLCLIESCAVCGRTVKTPFASLNALGAVLQGRKDGNAAQHPVEGECWKLRAVEGMP